MRNFIRLDEAEWKNNNNGNFKQWSQFYHITLFRHKYLLIFLNLNDEILCETIYYFLAILNRYGKMKFEIKRQIIFF